MEFAVDAEIVLEMLKSIWQIQKQIVLLRGLA